MTGIGSNILGATADLDVTGGLILTNSGPGHVEDHPYGPRCVTYHMIMTGVGEHAMMLQRPRDNVCTFNHMCLCECNGCDHDHTSNGTKYGIENGDCNCGDGHLYIYCCPCGHK